MVCLNLRDKKQLKPRHGGQEKEHENTAFEYLAVVWGSCLEQVDLTCQIQCGAWQANVKGNLCSPPVLCTQVGGPEASPEAPVVCYVPGHSGATPVPPLNLTSQNILATAVAGVAA